jgi:hypothetical protein
MAAERWHAGVNHYVPLIARIIDQSERRVLKGEAPAGEKLEPHADIIVKGGLRCIRLPIRAFRRMPPRQERIGRAERSHRTYVRRLPLVGILPLEAAAITLAPASTAIGPAGFSAVVIGLSSHRLSPSPLPAATPRPR